MMIDAPTRVGMPLDEFIAEMEQKPFELLDGEKKYLMPSVLGPGELALLIYDAILFYMRDQKILGRVMHEITFVLPDMQDKQWVKGSRIPDVMFYAGSRYADYVKNTPDYYSRPLSIIPDLVVEVISPTDVYADVMKKVALYLSDGVRLVWVVDVQGKAVSVHYPDQTAQLITGEGALTGGDVLAGFSLPLAELFKAG